MIQAVLDLEPGLELKARIIQCVLQRPEVTGNASIDSLNYEIEKRVSISYCYTCLIVLGHIYGSVKE